MHYYQFNIGDYASHTRHLTQSEDLAYRRLLDEYYLHERPLNACVTTVSRQINMRGMEDSVEVVLREFFVLSENGWLNDRADREINHYRAKIEQASKAGKASAQRKINARSTDVQPTNNQEPITNNQEPMLEIAPAKAEASTKSKGTRLPFEWQLPDEWILDAKEIGLDDISAYTEGIKFKDYWIALAGAKARKADWRATWRNWVRRSIETKHRGQSNAERKQSLAEHRAKRDYSPANAKDF